MHPDLDHIQKSTPGFLAEVMPRSTKRKVCNDSKIFTMGSMEGLADREKLVCTNHDLHESQKSIPPLISVLLKSESFISQMKCSLYISYLIYYF